MEKKRSINIQKGGKLVGENIDSFPITKSSSLKRTDCTKGLQRSPSQNTNKNPGGRGL